MSHRGDTADPRERRASHPSLSFGGVLRSEAIKLVSLRSTGWCYALVVALTIGLGVLFAASFFNSGALPPEVQQSSWVQGATLGIAVSQLVVAVLGVLVISGEYGTGMIRSTFAAVPRRLPALAAKALVIGLTTFLVALVSIVAAAILPSGLLPAAGIEPDFGDAGVWWALVGGAGYLALLAVLALTIGAIVRNSAGGIATVLGLILVLPGVLTVFGLLTDSTLLQNLAAFLPDAAGGRMYTYVIESQPAAADLTVLEPWQGLVVLTAWVVASGVIASVLVRSRDA